MVDPDGAIYKTPVGLIILYIYTTMINEGQTIHIESSYTTLIA